MRIKRLLPLIVSLILLLGSPLKPAQAWEFDLTGFFSWSDWWFNQQGPQGFFGNYGIDAANLGTASMNFWDGGQFDTCFVSGANAAQSLMHIDFNPVIKVNNAIRMFAHYRLNTWNNPYSSYYITEDAPGVHNAWTEGQWDMFWITANTPLGALGLGKRPWQWGTGLQYDGADSISTESLALVAPYGPFDIGLAFYPYRFAGRSHIDAFYRPYHMPVLGDPYDLPTYNPVDHINGSPGTQGSYYSHADRSGSFANDFLLYVMYFNGPFTAGILGSYGSFHIGPEADLPPSGVASPIVPVDMDLFHGSIYQKYNNGRFFVNSELAWLYWTDRFRADASNGNGAMPNPLQNQGPWGQVGPQGPRGPLGFPALPQTRYVEQLKASIEAGLLCGPAKISFFSLWTPGPDRRGGMYIDRQPAAFIRHPNYDIRLSNYSQTVPYAWLFTFDYGAGLNAYNLCGDGYIRDAFALAGRLDYAVASNLNLFGSFFWAERTSDGYERGCLRPIPGNSQVGSNGNIDFSRVMPGPFMSQNINTPNITERSLGYEVDLGVNWKLLEGLQLSTLLCYWAPGKWFTYACVDRSNPLWNDNNDVTGITGAEDRHIDAVIGGTYNIICDF
ncbi:MAG: hypothetical protein ACP5VS_14425 [Desulfomonilaceae bacterium]